MTSAYIELLKETFEDLEQLNPEKVKKLAQETVGYFRELQGKFGTTDRKEKDAVENEVLEIKELLEVQMDKILNMTGLSPEQLANMSQTELGQAEKEAIGSMKEQLQEFQPEQRPVKRAGKNKQKLRLLG